jgi:hypothetical protein
MTERDVFERRFQATIQAYVRGVATDLDPVELAHRIASAGPRRHGLAALRMPRRTAGMPLAWILLTAVLLAAVAGAALVGARLLRATSPYLHRDVALEPTGIDVITPDVGAYSRVVADGEGVLWASHPAGRLVRYDTATGSGRTWTIGDDAAFAATDIAAARVGGVWLVGEDALRWFDGAVFREVIDTPNAVALLAQAPDGGVWATTPTGTILHWDGSSWSRFEMAPPDAKPTATDIRAIAVDASGRPWVGWASGPTSDGWLASYDGATWTAFTEEASAPLGSSVRAIAPAPDGGVWVATEGGLARYDGSAWTDRTAGSGMEDGDWTSMAAGPDGMVWTVGQGTEDRFSVHRFDGTTGPSASVVAGPSGLGAGDVSVVLPVEAGTYLGTSTTIYRLADGRWEQAWSAPAGDPGPRIEPDWRPLLAVSRDELWAIGRDGGAWRFRDSAWTLESIDPARPGGRVWGLALAPDGTPWAAGDDGVAYWRDERWVVVDATTATRVAVDRDGTAWVVDGDSHIWTLRPSGTTWTRTSIPASPRNLTVGGAVTSIAVDGQGTLWAGANGFVVDALARYADGRWETTDASDGVPDNIGVEVLGISSTGDVWIGFRPSSGGPNGYARLDGTEWTVVEPPGDVVMAPDGTPWTGDLARYDGRAWTYPYAGIPLSLGSLSVAADGTIFGFDRSSGTIIRLPEPPRDPAAS